MRNMITFAEEYRLKNYEEMPFGVIDSLILSQISYYDYAGSTFERKYFNKRICDFFRERPNIILSGMMTAAGDEKLITVLTKGGRHGDLRACRYVEDFSIEMEKQFSAITFELGYGEYYIAFRGTDNSVVGWKEDFALSFQKKIPAQVAALRYAEESMLRFPGRFYIGGHSKGGNLAVYAAMNLPEALQKRIKKVYNFDGPGFMEEVYVNSDYRRIRPLICKIVPQSSVIGMILEEDNNYHIVHSNADALLQHDPYTWEVIGADFEYRDSVDAFSRWIKRSLDGWLDELTLDERRKIVNTVFDVIYDTGINAFNEMSEVRFEKIKALLDSASNVDQEEKKRVHTAVKRLLSIAAEELHRTAKEGVLQFEKSAAQIEKFLQSVQRGELNKIK